MKNKGFTLVELLAVIAILGILLTIAVPSIVGLIEKATKDAFLIDAKMITKVINNKVLEDYDFNPNFLNENNMEEKLNVSNFNYKKIVVIEDDDKNVYIKIIGKNKWKGLTACGTYNTMQVGISGEIKCLDPFICGNEITYEGYDYKTIKIGDQCWFKENLRYIKDDCLNNLWEGTELYDACMIHSKEDCIIVDEDYYCDWPNEEVLYQWNAAMDNNGEESQGLCPDGWHIPTDYEWMVLEAYVDSEYKDILEDDEESEWNRKTISYRGFDAWRRCLSSPSDGINRELNSKALGRSIRCLRN